MRGFFTLTLAAAIAVCLPASAADRFQPVYETVMGRLGSRFYVNPQPQKMSWKQSPLGSFMDIEESFYAGVSVDGLPAALPFQKEVPRLLDAETALTMTTATYKAHHLSGVYVEMKITAPFYPRDEKLSSAPFFYIDLKVTNRAAEAKTGSLFIGETFDRGFKVEETEISGMKGFSVEGGYAEEPRNRIEVYANPERYQKVPARQAFILDGGLPGAKWFPSRLLAEISPGAKEKPNKKSAGLTAPFSLGPEESATVRIILAAHVAADNVFIGLGDKPYGFKYVKLFPEIKDVVAFAHASAGPALEKSRKFDTLFEDTTMQDSYKNFLAFAFQSWIINTVWAVSPGMPEWFSELEGDCLWHSTVDVSYNTALVYYELWPELLRMQLDEWPLYLRDGKIIMHDMGRLRDMRGTDYSMPVEEDANYILMLHHFLAAPGGMEFVREKMPLVRALTGYIFECDADGNGFPEKGNYNTYERHLPNPLGAQDVVYVAVKAYAAIRAAEELALLFGDKDLAAKSRAFIEKFTKTLDSRAWKNDHYVICLQDTIPAGEIRREWTLPRASLPLGPGVYADEIKRGPDGSNAEAVPLRYYDAYTILTTNGLFYLYRGGVAPGADAARMKQDLVSATRWTWREGGNPHTGNPDDRGMWLSANIWRDMTAAYMGLDLSDNFDAYWPAALSPKLNNEGAFADSHFYDMDPPKGWDLRYYPRGITAIGVPAALAGMSLDAKTKTIRFRPVRAGLRAPLLAFADWDTGRAPWISVVEKDGRLTVEVTGGSLPSEWRIEAEK